MNAVLQDEANGKLYTATVPVPRPSKGEVLVKMAASPINPSDLSFLKGTYIQKPIYPLIPGIEGSGKVVASGGGILANLRLNKRVTCSSTEGQGGTWAEYMLTSAMRVVPIKSSIDLEQGAMLIVNPMTVLAFMSIAKKGKHKAIINNAAASVLGRMLIKLCKTENLPLINIVRRKEQVELLKKEGAEFILNTEEPEYFEKLKELSHGLQATLIFDAVVGEQTTKLLKATPKGSTLIVYANLSEKAISVEAGDLIQGDKQIGNFYLSNWASKRSIIQSLSTARKVQKLVGEELSSQVQKKFPFKQANDALNYYRSNMTGGKVILVIDSDMH